MNCRLIIIAVFYIQQLLFVPIPCIIYVAMLHFITTIRIVSIGTRTNGVGQARRQTIVFVVKFQFGRVSVLNHVFKKVCKNLGLVAKILRRRLREKKYTEHLREEKKVASFPSTPFPNQTTYHLSQDGCQGKGWKR